MPHSKTRAPRFSAKLDTHKIGCIRPLDNTYITPAWRAHPCHSVARARSWVYKKLGGGGWVREEDGRGERKTAMIYYPPQILFLLRARQLRSRSSIFFPFTAHRATLRPTPIPLARLSTPASRRIVSPFARPLCSAPSLKVTDCLLYYPLVSIFTLLSEALPMSIVPATDSYDHNTVLKDLSARIIVGDVVGFVVI